MKLSYQTKLFTALGLVYVVWGSTYLGVKLALHVFPPLLLTAVRFLIGGGLLFAFTVWRGAGLPTKEQLIGASKLGVFLSGVGTGAVAFAIGYVPSGIVALLVATLPLWTFLLDFFFFSRSKPSLLSGIGLLLGIVGMVFLLNPFEHSVEHAIPFWPTLVVFVGSISWSYGSLISYNTPQPAAVQSTAVQMFAGGVFALFLSIILENDHLGVLQRVDRQAFWALAYLIFIGSYVGYTAYVWLMNNAPPLLTSTYAYINPVVALFLGWFFVDELLDFQTVVASAIIVSGVVLMTLGRKKGRTE
ncbi:MAG: EamA family transporter [Spirosomataceae bacterium]